MIFSPDFGVEIEGKDEGNWTQSLCLDAINRGTSISMPILVQNKQILGILNFYFIGNYFA